MRVLLTFNFHLRKKWWANTRPRRDPHPLDLRILLRGEKLGTGEPKQLSRLLPELPDPARLILTVVHDPLNTPEDQIITTLTMMTTILVPLRAADRRQPRRSHIRTANLINPDHLKSSYFFLSFSFSLIRKHSLFRNFYILVPSYCFYFYNFLLILSSRPIKFHLDSFGAHRPEDFYEPYDKYSDKYTPPEVVVHERANSFVSPLSSRRLFDFLSFLFLFSFNFFYFLFFLTFSKPFIFIFQTWT